MKSWSSWSHVIRQPTEIFERKCVTGAVAAAHRGKPVSGDAHESRRKRTDAAAN